MTTIERYLNSIGKKFFIVYYENFRSRTNKNELTQKLLTNIKNTTREAVTLA